MPDDYKKSHHKCKDDKCLVKYNWFCSIRFSRYNTFKIVEMRRTKNININDPTKFKF